MVDDGSTDGMVEIARRYLSDSRVRLVQNERNLGQFQNRNRAATLARGEYLKYHDSDDLMYPHCLAVMAQALSAEPHAALALSAHTAWPGGPSPMLLTPSLAYEREFLGSGLFQQSPASALFRADAFRELGGFPTAGVASDYLFWLKACAVVNVLLVPGDLFYYRLHAGQELVSPKALREYARSSSAAWEMLNSGACPLTGNALEVGKRNFAFIQAREIYRSLKRGRFGPAIDIVRHSGLGVRDWMIHLRPPRRNAAAGTPPGPSAT